MQIDAFDYDLPEELIAQTPAPRRDQSRLLVVQRDQPGKLAHYFFHELPILLEPGDLVVLNDTRVVAARLLGHKARTGGKWEGLFVRELPNGLWELLVQTRGRLAVGETLIVSSANGELNLELVEKIPPGRWLVRPAEAATDSSATAATVLARYGQVPIPPYIRKGRAVAEDQQRYQTVHAARDGAVAAPTAGLHFTPEIFAALQARGIEHAFVTLHVGPGTFQPIKVEDVHQHKVEAEWGELPEATRSAIASCKRRGGRVVAVGTTTVRVLETAARAGGGGRIVPSDTGHGDLTSWKGLTDLTICPPFEFRVIDALLTNFHLPRSSLLLLVAAFAGLETIQTAYREAVRCQYRFYSYGDAMLIV